MPLPFRPRFVYGETDTALSLPMYPWEIEDRAVGGHAVASSGEEEAFIVRYDRAYRLRLRMTEEEWGTVVQPMLRWARQRAQPVEVWLDREDDYTAVPLLLVEPVAGDVVRPERTPYLRTLELDTVWRTVDDGAWPAVWADG